jgi:NAD-dependent deacetylase
MKIVVFTGSGISAESGIATFRGNDGLWANYRIEDVCTPEALLRNREGVIEFYNLRRRELLSKEPNAAHYSLVALEQYFDVEIITQNIDDLHERAGSTRVTHLHGELRKLRSSRDENATIPIEGWEQRPGERHSDGSLLRPFVVFFGEQVPMLEKGIDITGSADIFIVAGTSLQVYPAASLLHYVNKGVPVYVVDPESPPVTMKYNPVQFIRKTAVEGVKELADELIRIYCK